MADVITIYNKESKEYKRLEAAGKLIEAETGCSVVVKNTYFDYEQDWKWTTLIAEPVDRMTYQILCPRDYKKIVAGDMDEFVEAVKTVIREGRW